MVQSGLYPPGRALCTRCGPRQWRWNAIRASLRGAAHRSLQGCGGNRFVLAPRAACLRACGRVDRRTPAPHHMRARVASQRALLRARARLGRAKAEYRPCNADAVFGGLGDRVFGLRSALPDPLSEVNGSRWPPARSRLEPFRPERYAGQDTSRTVRKGWPPSWRPFQEAGIGQCLGVKILLSTRRHEADRGVGPRAARDQERPSVDVSLLELGACVFGFGTAPGIALALSWYSEP